MTNQLKKKILLFSAISSALIAGAVGLDMTIAGSIYHPLVYFYNTASWLECLKSQKSNCNNKKLSTTKAPVSASNGMVVTEQHLASSVGLQILKQGGNAIDAAVAVGYALAVTNPCCGNIGGGGFMLIHTANGKDTFIDFREQAPRSSKPNMYLSSQGKVIPGLSTKGYLAVGVPGTVAGLDKALAEYGTMKRAQVIEPAIALAEQGFVLQPGDVKLLETGTNKFKAQPNVAAIFLKNGKTPYQVGSSLVQKNLAQTLKLISRLGPDAFYKGSITGEIVKASQEHKGILTQQDFADYRVSETRPVECNYRGYQVISAPPPGGGTVLCEMLNIIEGYPLSKLGFHTSDSLHKILSAFVYAYVDRNTYLGDPAFVNNPTERLLSKEYATQIRAKIPENRAIPPKQLYSGITSPEGTHTTHYSISDRYGNAVAVTYTINSLFGAEVIAGNTGFILNNEMDDFTAKPGVPNAFGLVQGSANQIAPGKRPLSSMSPTIVMKNGKVFMITGSPGGSTITTTVLQVMTNVIDYGMNIQEAVDAPRIHYQGLPNLIFTEPSALDSTTVQNLGQMGYRVFPRSTWGVAESILEPKTGLVYGANDRRRAAGEAVGY